MLDAEVLRTSISYKLGNNSQEASLQILQRCPTLLCSAAAMNSITSLPLSCCRHKWSLVSPLSSLPITGGEAAHRCLTRMCTWIGALYP